MSVPEKELPSVLTYNCVSPLMVPSKAGVPNNVRSNEACKPINQTATVHALPKATGPTPPIVISPVLVFSNDT